MNSGNQGGRVQGEPRTCRLISWLGLLYCLLGSWYAAQGLAQDQFPPGINWRQINTPHYQLIFPQEITSEAQRMANTLEYLQRPLRYSLKAPATRWNLLLNSRSNLGNGYVTLAPRKSVWYGTPSVSSSAGSTEWFNLLAVHEGRHMVQFDAMNQGFTRLGYYLFGDIGQLLLSGLALPVWFWEGDAVCTETALTASGRGRLPEFDKETRAQLLAGRHFPYAKAFLGSYRDYAGDYYQLGYLLVSEGRLRFGTQFWNQVLYRTMRRSFNPLAISRALKATTGQNLQRFYTSVMDSLRQRWTVQQVQIQPTACRLLLPPVSCYTNYIFPTWIGEGQILALKYGYGDIPTVVRMDTSGHEEVVTYLPNSEFITIAREQIAWVEFDDHPRWRAVTEANVIVYDLRQGRRRNLTQHGNYPLVAIAPDGERLAAVKFTTDRKCYLVLMDAHTGQELAVLSDSLSTFIKYPRWSVDGRRLVYVRQVDNAITLTVYDLAQMMGRDLLPLGRENISHPVFWGDFVLYGSPYSGIDNIYAVSLIDGRRYQVTCRPLGADYPMAAATDSLLIFSDYTVDGYRIGFQRLNPHHWKPLEEVKVIRSEVHARLAAQEQRAPVDWEQIPRVEYPVRPYAPLRHLLNIHSWVILPASPIFMGGIMSNDILNTTAVTLLMNFNTDERTFGITGEASYAGRFPIVNLKADVGRRRTVTDNSGVRITDYWQEQNLGVGVEVPLDIGQGIWGEGITLAGGVGYINVQGKEGGGQENGALLPVDYRLSYSRQRYQAARDLQTPLGWTLYLDFQHTPVRLEFYGRRLTLMGKGYLQGLTRHHGCAIELAVEKQWAGNYQYESSLAFPRGYEPVTVRQFFKGSWNYVWPLFYPDWALGNWFYLKRVHQALFYDYGMAADASRRRLFRSAGTELLGDFHLLSLPIEICGGVRLAYAFDERHWRREMVLAGIGL